MKIKNTGHAGRFKSAAAAAVVLTTTAAWAHHGWSSYDADKTVKVEAPDKPIEINMNVSIEHRVKVEIDRDVQTAMKNNKDIF